MRAAGQWIVVAALVLGGTLPLQAAEGPAAVKMTDFIAPEFFLAAIVHPSRLVQSPAGKHLWAQQAKTPHPVVAKIQPPPEQIRRIVALAGPNCSPAVILQFENDFDSRGKLTQAFPQAQTLTIEGKPCLKISASGQPALVAHVAGPRLLLLGPEEMLQKMLRPSDQPRPLLEQLRQADLKHDIVLEVVAAPLTEQLTALAKKAQAPQPPAGPGPGGMDPLAAIAASMGTMGPVLEDLKGASVQVDFGGPTLFQAKLTGVKKDSPDKLLPVVNMFVMMANQPAPPNAAGPGPAGGPPPEVQAILKTLKVTKVADGVLIQLPMPPKFAELVEQAIKQGPPAGGPDQSSNPVQVLPPAR